MYNNSLGRVCRYPKPARCQGRRSSRKPSRRLIVLAPIFRREYRNTVIMSATERFRRGRLSNHSTDTSDRTFDDLFVNQVFDTHVSTAVGHHRSQTRWGLSVTALCRVSSC